MQTVSSDTQSVISRLADIANNNQPALFEMAFHSGKKEWLASFKVGIGKGHQGLQKTVMKGHSLRACLIYVLDEVENRWLLK